jgi:hypothetical protein
MLKMEKGHGMDKEKVQKQTAPERQAHNSSEMTCNNRCLVYKPLNGFKRSVELTIILDRPP